MGEDRDLTREELVRELEEARKRVAALETAESEHRRTAERLEQEGQRLHASEQRYRILYNSSRDAIMVLEPGAAFVGGNPAAIELFRCRDEEQFTSCSPADLSPELQPDGVPSSEKAQRIMATTMETGSQFFEWEHRRIDGSVFPATVLLTRMELEGKSYLQATVRDITQQKVAEAALRATRDAAEAASRAKSDFLANMSHEIHTPMNAIIGMTDLLLESGPTGQQFEYLKVVKESADLLLSLIDEILDLSRIEAGKLTLDVAPFDVRESLGDSMRLLAVRAHAKGLELALRIHFDVPRRLVGDAGRLRQIVVNLVGNGIKFTEVGEVVLTVDVHGQTDEGLELHLAVSDTGIGIPREKQASVFDMFEQADPSPTRRFGGSGLGLAISARLLDLMGGRIWMESVEGLGSTFHCTVKLGLAPAEEGDDLAGRAVDVRNLRVLVVDDNATNRLILDEMLLSWGMRPSSSDGTRAALEALREAQRSSDPYRLIVTDAQMPELDGFELARQIQQDLELDGVVMMMLTSGSRPEDVARCAELGVSAYLQKPVKQSELLDAVLTALGRAPQPVAQRVEPAPAVSLSRLRVLLVEDNPFNQMLAVKLLEKHGHSVVLAKHGKEALEVLEDQTFDVALMDLQMPEMDGFEATHAIRKREAQAGGHLPIVAFTAHALTGDRERCLEAGMDAYVSKPIQRKELFDTIASVVPGVAAGDD